MSSVALARASCPPPVALPSPSSGPPPPGVPARAALPEAAWWWRADAMAGGDSPTWSTGYPALDAELPGGGWPASGLTELLLAQPGSGELRLLAPVLQAQGAARPLLWVAPPLPPYAPALQQLGLPLARLVWVAPTGVADAVWAAEQALRARCGAMVLWWGDAPAAAWRRLHLAAQDGGGALWALRPLAARTQASPAPLRLLLEPAPGGQLAVLAVKRRGPVMATPLRLSLPPVLPPLRRAVAPAPWAATNPRRAAPADGAPRPVAPPAHPFAGVDDAVAGAAPALAGA